jgi:hypothetical protein
MEPRTRALTLGGALTALALIFLSAGAFLPTATLSFYALSSLPIAIAVLETGWRRALLVYLSASLLSLAWPGLHFSYLFIFFFGLFPILKAGIESRLRPAPARLCKQLAATVLLLVSGFLFVRQAMADRMVSLAFWLRPVLLLALQAAIFVYDYALSLLITFYMDRLARHFRP